MTKRKSAYGGRPPAQDAACVAGREAVLETSAQAYDPTSPGLCRDDQPVQGLQETRVPIAATPQPGRRVDDAYERNGPASMCLCAEPLSGFRQATARIRQTNADGASAVADRLDTRSAACEDVPLGCDHLTTHTPGAFSEACEPARARASIQRLHCCDPPQPGSGLPVAACERRGFTRQCLRDRRSGVWTALQSAIAAWSNKTQAKQRGVAWPCRIENARGKLKRLYPKIKA